MLPISKKLKIQTTALSLFLQSILSAGIGMLMIWNHKLFFSKAPILFLAFFSFLMAMNFVEMLISGVKCFKHALPKLLQFIAGGAAIIYFSVHHKTLLTIIPVVMLGWSLLYALSSFISFLQYRVEANTKAVRYLMSSVLHFIFGIEFVKYAYQNLFVSVKLIGIYLILLGITMFLDGIAVAMPERYANRCKSRLKVTLPAFITAFVPLTFLNCMDEFYKADGEDLTPVREVKGTLEPNIEVFVHLGKTLKGLAGHVDIKIDNEILCYGTYDRESIRLGGVLGAGVVYEVYNKEEYLKFCREVREETVIEYGFAFTEEELQLIREKRYEIKSRTSLWKCKAQRALEANLVPEEIKDMSCKLAMAMETKFYKFALGEYKYYWILGSNCVKFTDELLKASGIKTILANLVTPGAYFTYLNDEFLKGSNRIVSRTVYYGRTVERN